MGFLTTSTFTTVICILYPPTRRKKLNILSFGACFFIFCSCTKDDLINHKIFFLLDAPNLSTITGFNSYKSYSI